MEGIDNATGTITNRENKCKDKNNDDWNKMANEKGSEIGNVNREINSTNIIKVHMDVDDATRITETNIDVSGMSEVEKDIFQFIQNGKSVYADSKEEPSMIYYNKEGNLMAYEYSDTGQAELFRSWLRNETKRFVIGEVGYGTINIRLNNVILSNNKKKNLVKITYILHKTGYTHLGIEMINRSTARILFQNKEEANTCLDFFEIHNKLVTVFIENKEIMHRGIISDWPNGIPELFDAMDSRDNIIKMERIKKRIWNKDNDTSKTVASDNIIVTFRGKDCTDHVSIYDRMGFLRVKPYVKAVKQCYSCYRYGHIKSKCKSNTKCPICGKDAHGECNSAPHCINCGGNHKSNYRGCIEYQRNKDMCIIMAHNNCSFFEAEKLVDGRDMKVPINYDRYLSPQSWPSLPLTSKSRPSTRKVETALETNPQKNKNPPHKRPIDSGQNIDKEHKINKVRVLEKRPSNINERIIKNNIKKSGNIEQYMEKRDFKNLAYMCNFNNHSENSSFHKEDSSYPNDSEGELNDRKETKDRYEYTESSEERVIRVNRVKAIPDISRDKTRKRATYSNI